jgi:hypothetical protein
MDDPFGFDLDLASLFVGQSDGDEDGTSDVEETMDPPDSIVDEASDDQIEQSSTAEDNQEHHNGAEKRRVEKFLNDASQVINAETFKKQFPTETFEHAVVFLLTWEIYHSTRTVNPVTIVFKSLPIYVELMASMIPGLVEGTIYAEQSTRSRLALLKTSAVYTNWFADLKEDWGLACFRGCGTVEPFFEADIRRCLETGVCNHGIHGRLMGVLLHFVRHNKNGSRGGS